jgi:hypothetical protein
LVSQLQVSYPGIEGAKLSPKKIFSLFEEWVKQKPPIIKMYWKNITITQEEGKQLIEKLIVQLEKTYKEQSEKTPPASDVVNVDQPLPLIEVKAKESNSSDDHL